MKKFCNFAQLLVVVIASTTMGFSVDAHGQLGCLSRSPLNSKSTAIGLSVAVPKDHFVVGQRPWVVLTVKNLSNKAIPIPDDCVYVEGDKGEAPMTLWQRQITGRTRSGERVLVGGSHGALPVIQPRGSFTTKRDLSMYYHLDKPGKYTVYFVVSDPLKGWDRSPKAVFEMEAKPQ